MRLLALSLLVLAVPCLAACGGYANAEPEDTARSLRDMISDSPSTNAMLILIAPGRRCSRSARTDGWIPS